MNTLEQLKKDALTELKELLIDNPDQDEYDIIAEIADSSTPIYTSDILQLAADNIDLAVVEPEIGPAFDGSPTPVNIIAANIYEEIQKELFSKLENIKAEIEEESKEECDFCGGKFEEGTLNEQNGDLFCEECLEDDENQL
ncbi:MAG: hypothetical protein ACW98F_08160 [Candidatus Hodarchaeales archaeon]|jgi:hypothetical protein